MLTKRIIPCLDVTGGRVVKGTNFVNLRDAGDPVELARFYDREGADELVFLDITASSDHRETMVDVVARTAEQVFIPLTVGGGIRTVEDVRRMLQAGADKVSMNTAAVQEPELISRGAERFGSQCIVVAIDAKRVGAIDAKRVGEIDAKRVGEIDAKRVVDGEERVERTANGTGRWEVYTHGGRRPTGIDAVAWAMEAEALGAGEILLTSMDADGTLRGYDLGLTAAISGAVGIPVIASGGAGELAHLFDGLATGLADAVLVASIFHYGTHTIKEAKEYLAGRGVPVRL